MHETPYRYLHLDYPEQLQFKPLRSEARFRFESPLTLNAETSLGMRLENIIGRFSDISLNGACIATDQKLGEVVKRLTFATDITIGGVAQTLELAAEIKRDFGRDDEQPDHPHNYGIAFVDITPEQQMRLMALCYELSNDPATNFF